MNIKSALLLAVVLLGMCQTASCAGQVTNPSYLSEMPSVERVMREMEVDDPRQTPLRQLAALHQLTEIIKAMAGPREFRGLTSDESRQIQAYNDAYNRLAQQADSAFPGPYGKWKRFSLNEPYRYSRSDPRFGVEGTALFKRFFSPAFRAQFDQAIAADAARHQAFQQAQQNAYETAKANAAAAATQQQQSSGKSGRELARCVESGRSESQCMSEGIGKGFDEFVGSVAPSLKQAPAQAGLSMSGVYAGQGGLKLTFLPESVLLGCGSLEPAVHNYAITMKDNRVLVSIQNEPKPIVFTFRPDEKLAGAAQIDVTGQVVVGTRHGIRTYADGRTEPIAENVYATRTVHCASGILAPTGQTPAAAAIVANPLAIMGTLFGGVEQATAKLGPPGLRMNGTFAGPGSISIEFHPDSAMLGCGEAVLAHDYRVEKTDTQVLVKIQDPAGPIVLTLTPDGKLSGSGPVQVNGRAITGRTPDGELLYAPRTNTCNLALLTPASGAPAGSAAAATPTGPTPPSAPASGSGTVSLAGPEGNAVLSVASGFPAQAGMPNPLAGRPLFLLRDSYETALEKGGFHIPPGMSATKAIAIACQKGRTPECQKGFNAIPLDDVALVTTDSNGKAAFPAIPAGTYYLWATAQVRNPALMWNLRVDLKPGENTLTLDRQNAAIVDQ